MYHLIDYNCEMLDSETGSTKLLLAAYLIVLALWLYRNVVHYPNTMTVLHRLLTIPPVLKVMLMATNYMMFYLCPWKNANLRIYIILIRILINLVLESMLIGIFFLISMGFKIAKSNVSIRNFVIMLT